MIAEVIQTIQNEFSANWDGVVQFEGTQKTITAEEWIHIDVAPIYVESLSYGGCVNEKYRLYVIAYHRNPVQAAALADKVIAFIQHRQIGNLVVRSWRPFTQGSMESGKAFIKFSLPLETIN